MNKPRLGSHFIKTRLDYFVYANRCPNNNLPRTLTLDIVKTVDMLLVYLLADPRLAEALIYSTVVLLTGSARSAPKPLSISNRLHSQHMSNERHKDVVNKALVKNRPASFVFEYGHPLNAQPKGMYEAEGVVRRYEHEVWARDVKYEAMTTPGA